MENKERLGRSLWSEIIMQLPLRIFATMKQEKVSFIELQHIRDNWVEFRNEQFGSDVINNTERLEYKNYFFKFRIYNNEFTIWDNDDKFLGSFCIKIENPPTEGFIEWINRIAEEYIAGIVHCSDCGREIRKNEIAGRYFAGVYCKECWDREWAEREAGESYD